MKLDESRQENNVKKAVESSQKMEGQIMEMIVDEIQSVLNNKKTKGEALKNIRKITNKIVNKNLKKIIKESEEALESNAIQTLKGLEEEAKEIFIKEKDEVADYFKKYITTKGTNFIVGKDQSVPQFFTVFIEKEIKGVVDGSISIETSISKAIEELAKAGLKIVEYDSGTRRNVDVFVRQQLLYAQKKSTQDIRENFASENGITIFEFDAHPNARPSHQLWQGKRYDITGKFYPTLNELTHGEHNDYGCKHRAYPVWNKEDEYMFSKEDLKNINTIPFDFKGKKYDGYEATQKQRMFERKIRALERERILKENKGIKDEALLFRLNKEKKEYKLFCKKMGTYVRKDRISVAF